ncbi:MAG: YjbQ family protein [Verrucomicrobia bacterium]|nr:YjbQ family protein [Verrucomicrobiota bacterium]
MKSFRQELTLHTPTRRAFLNLTPRIEAALSASRIQEGICLVNAMHITASVFINDNESGLHADFEAWLEKLAPEKPYSQYRGRLDFGPWEQIFYGEFDGRRDKRVLVKIIGE